MKPWTKLTESQKKFRIQICGGNQKLAKQKYDASYRSWSKEQKQKQPSGSVSGSSRQANTAVPSAAPPPTTSSQRAPNNGAGVGNLNNGNRRVNIGVGAGGNSGMNVNNSSTNTNNNQRAPNNGINMSSIGNALNAIQQRQKNVNNLVNNLLNKTVVYSNNRNKTKRERDWAEFSKKLGKLNRILYPISMLKENPKRGSQAVRAPLKNTGSRIIYNQSGKQPPSKEKIILLNTLNKINKINENIIDIKSFPKAFHIKVDKNNYEQFILNIDQESRDEKSLSKLAHNGCPFDISVPRLYDNGKVFMPNFDFGNFIINNYREWKILEKHKVVNNVNRYPRCIANFSPIIFKIKFSNKYVWVKYSYEFEEDKAKIQILRDEDGKKLLKNKGTLIQNSNNRTKNEIIRKIKNKINKIINKPDKILDNFYKFLTDETNQLCIEYDTFYGKNGSSWPTFTVDLDNPEIFRSVVNDIKHDFTIKTSEEEIYSKLWDEFNEEKKYKGWELKSEYPTISTKSNNIILTHNKIVNNTKNPNSPIIAKTLGDLGQIVYCIIKQKIFATGDSSAVNMAVTLAKETDKPLKVIYEKGSKYFFIKVNKSKFKKKVNTKILANSGIKTVNNISPINVNTINYMKNKISCKFTTKGIVCNYLGEQVKIEELLKKALSKINKPNGVNEDMRKQIIEALSTNNIKDIIYEYTGNNPNKKYIAEYIKRLANQRNNLLRIINNPNAGQRNQASTSGTRRNN